MLHASVSNKFDKLISLSWALHIKAVRKLKASVLASEIPGTSSQPRFEPPLTIGARKIEAVAEFEWKPVTCIFGWH